MYSVLVWSVSAPALINDRDGWCHKRWIWAISLVQLHTTTTLRRRRKLPGLLFKLATNVTPLASSQSSFVLWSLSLVCQALHGQTWLLRDIHYFSTLNDHISPPSTCVLICLETPQLSSQFRSEKGGEISDDINEGVLLFSGQYSDSTASRKHLLFFVNICSKCIITLGSN